MFGVQPNVPLMHQVVTAQLAARRSGTQSTKTRAEVRGGGRKPFKQKGTGNARQGSTRSPHFSGGGVAHGPKPRKYDQKTPKKMIKLALHSALSDRAADGKVVVVDSWGFEAPKTKDAKKLLSALGVDGKALVVVNIDDTNTIKSFLNLPEVQLIESRGAQRLRRVVQRLRGLLPRHPARWRRRDDSQRRRRRRPQPKGSAEEEAARAEPVSTKVDEPAADDTTPDYPGSVKADGDGARGLRDQGQRLVDALPRARLAFYNRTVPEYWFATTEDAEAAGFQLPPSQRPTDEDGDES